MRFFLSHSLPLHSTQQAEIQAKREKEEEERRRKEEEEQEKEAELTADPFTEVVNPYFTSSYDLFARDVKPFDPFPMFPHSEATQKFDAFGEVRTLLYFVYLDIFLKSYGMCFHCYIITSLFFNLLSLLSILIFLHF